MDCNGRKNAAAAVVLGSYVNGYSIVKELSQCSVKNIILIDYNRSLSFFSNKVSEVIKIEKSPKVLLSALEDLRHRYGYLVVYPTDDLQLEMLHEIYEKIAGFCFTPFNDKNLLESLDKSYQYEICEKAGVPYPKSHKINDAGCWDGIESLDFPVLVKPDRREDLKVDIFRNRYFDSFEDIANEKEELLGYVLAGVALIVSEYIPGDDTNIYAYIAYRGKNGSIYNEWSGKKLTQFPNHVGVFSSASNIAPEVVSDQGRALVEAMDLYGIVEPEFKYDSRDGLYKLMEINLRSMMWHRLGNRCGVYLQYTQWCDAIGADIPRQQQDNRRLHHLVYMKHEIINLLTRSGYWKHFKHNIWGGELRDYAVYDRKDIKPFLYDFYFLTRSVAGIWLRRFRRK